MASFTADSQHFSFDFEFVDTPNGGTHPISLAVSHGNNEVFYAEFSDFPEHHCDDWLKKNVLSKLLFHKRFPINKQLYPLPNELEKQNGDDFFIVPFYLREDIVYNDHDGDVYYYGTTEFIRDKFIEFIEMNCFTGEKYNSPIFYGWYCSFDWYLLSKMFGRMIDIQSFFKNVTFPFYPIDLRTLSEVLGINDAMRAAIKSNDAGEHNALVDAIEIAERRQYISEFLNSKTCVKNDNRNCW